MSGITPEEYADALQEIINRAHIAVSTYRDAMALPPPTTMSMEALAPLAEATKSIKKLIKICNKSSSWLHAYNEHTCPLNGGLSSPDPLCVWCGVGMGRPTFERYLVDLQRRAEAAEQHELANEQQQQRVAQEALAQEQKMRREEEELSRRMREENDHRLQRQQQQQQREEEERSQQQRHAEKQHHQQHLQAEEEKQRDQRAHTRQPQLPHTPHTQQPWGGLGEGTGASTGASMSIGKGAAEVYPQSPPLPSTSLSLRDSTTAGVSPVCGTSPAQLTQSMSQSSRSNSLVPSRSRSREEEEVELGLYEELQAAKAECERLRGLLARAQREREEKDNSTALAMGRLERDRANVEERARRAEAEKSRVESERDRERTRREQAEAQCAGLQRRVQELEAHVNQGHTHASTHAGTGMGANANMNTGIGAGAGAGDGAAPNGFISASHRLALDRGKRPGFDGYGNTGAGVGTGTGAGGYEGDGGNAPTGAYGRPGPRRFVPPYKQPPQPTGQAQGQGGPNGYVAGGISGANLGNAPPFVRKALNGPPGGGAGAGGRVGGGAGAGGKPVAGNNNGNANGSTAVADNVGGIPLDQEGKLPGRLAACETNLVELIMFEMLDRSPGVRWDDIAGLEFAKKNVVEIVVWPLQRPDLFTGLRGPPKGMLLFGPPGTGKTLIGKAIATESEAHFFSISASSLTSKWHGQGEKLVRTLFAVASYYEPAVIFIDEIDSLLSQRQDAEFEASRRIKTELLIQLDGAASSTPCLTWRGDEVTPRILVVGATNRPHELDEAARRRLVKKLYVPLPNAKARGQLIRRLLRDENTDINDEDLQRIVLATDGYSGADLKALCTEAAYGPLRDVTDLSRIASADSVRPICVRDFDNALRLARASVDSKDLKGLEEWNRMFGSFPVEGNGQEQGG